MSLRRLLPILVLAGLLAGPAGCQSARPVDCVQVRAAWDVGSASTKVKVAQVDRCRGRILAVLLEASERVDYQEALAAEPRGRLGEAVRRRGLEAIRRLKARADRHGPTDHVGVATAALRRAGDGAAFVAKIARETGIDLAVATRDREARLGFRAAVTAAGVPPERAASWDIGGGSMQIVTHEPGGALRIHHGAVASVGFRDRVISEIQGQDPAQVRSPNPLGPENAERAVALARRIAGEASELVRRRLGNGRTLVLGIGGVHVYSIAGQVTVDDGAYTRDDVAAAIARRAPMGDDQIGGDYADTEVTNLCLVLGFMRELGIEAVRPLRVTMSDGLLVAPPSRAPRR